MNNTLPKKYPSIACCGIDCGLCPTYYTKGPSKCPGCGGPSFSIKHPSCSILSCCVKKNGYETCAECKDYPCEKLKNWDKGDSFVTHKKSLQNLYEIQQIGIENYIDQQTSRIEILEFVLNSSNEGRSKSFFCLATALLSIDDLNDGIDDVKRLIKDKNISSEDIKTKAKITKDILKSYAKNKNIELRLCK